MKLRIRPMQSREFGIKQLIVDGEVLHPSKAHSIFGVAQQHFVNILNETMLKLITHKDDLKPPYATWAYRFSRSVSSPLIGRYYELASRIAVQHFTRWFKQYRRGKFERPPFFKQTHPIEIDSRCGLRLTEGGIRFLLYQQGSGLPREIVLLLRLSDEDQEKTFKRFSEDWRVKRVLLTKNLRDRWVVKFVYEVPKKERQEANNVMGVDLGVVNFIAADIFPKSSKPLIIKGIDIIGRWRAFKMRLRRLQREASLHTDGSGRTKIRRLLRRVKGKMAGWRHDLLHKVTRRIVDWAKQNAVKTIVIEDLTGIREDIPFLSVFPYYKFFNVLQLKAQAEGIEVVRVDPYRTSKTCHLCGQDGETDDERVFHCKNPECGWHGDRDLNAARCIARRYLESQSREIEVPKYLKHKRDRNESGKKSKGKALKPPLGHMSAEWHPRLHSPPKGLREPFSAESGKVLICLHSLCLHACALLTMLAPTRASFLCLYSCALLTFCAGVADVVDRPLPLLMCPFNRRTAHLPLVSQNLCLYSCALLTNERYFHARLGFNLCLYSCALLTYDEDLARFLVQHLCLYSCALLTGGKFGVSSVTSVLCLYSCALLTNRFAKILAPNCGKCKEGCRRPSVTGKLRKVDGKEGGD